MRSSTWIGQWDSGWHVFEVALWYGAVAYVCLCLGEFVVQKDWMIASESMEQKHLLLFLHDFMGFYLLIIASAIMQVLAFQHRTGILEDQEEAAPVKGQKTLIMSALFPSDCA